MSDQPPDNSAQRAAQKLNLKATKRHIFICSGKADGKGCCSEELGSESWKRLKQAAANLASVAPGEVQRTSVKCLRICAEGPVAVVYPEGVWYRNCSGENLEKIIEQHLTNGEVVDELKIESGQ